MPLSKPHTVLVLLQSIKARPLEVTLLKQLLELGIPFELVEVSAKYPSPLPPKNEISCIISEPNSKCQAFASQKFPHTPVIHIPPSSQTPLRTLISSSKTSAGTLALGRAGEINAALLAASILGLHIPSIRSKLHSFRKKQTRNVLAKPNPAKA